MRLAFLGVGAMGAPIARNLAHAGHSLSIWNRTRERAEALRDGGIRVASTPADAARECEAAVTMLADDRAVEHVVFGRDGIAGALPQGAVHVSMSTISVALSKLLGDEHARRGQAYVAAPVFGRPEAAAERKLWVVAAGRAQDVETCRVLFEAIGRGFSVVASEPWKANVVKLSGNFLIAAMLEALGEAYALARKSGIEAKPLLEVVNSALFNSPLYGNYGAKVADEAFEPAGFKLRLGFKDVKLALDAAEAEALPMPLASLIRDRFLEAIARGRAESDWSAVAVMAAEDAGL